MDNDKKSFKLNKISLNSLSKFLKHQLLGFLSRREKIILSKVFNYDFSSFVDDENYKNPHFIDYLNKNPNAIEKYKEEVIFTNSGFNANELSEFLRTLIKLKKIKLLKLNDCYLSTKEEIKLLRYILNTKEIEELDMSRMKIDPDLLKILSKNTPDNETFNYSIIELFKKENINIKNLCFKSNSNPISIENVIEFNILNNSLISLNLCSCNLKIYHVDLLAKLILKNKSIKKLDISRNNLKCKGIKILSDSLREIAILEEINISENMIEDDGFNYLIDSIMQNKSNNLRVLESLGNIITDESSLVCFLKSEECRLTKVFLKDFRCNKIFILECFISNSTVKELYLSLDLLDYTECLNLLTNIIRNNNTLEKIALDSYPEKGEMNFNQNLLREAIEINKTLKVLLLQGFELISNDIKAIIEGLKVNRSIEVLDLSFNHSFDNVCADEVIKMLKINNKIKSLLICECGFSLSTNDFIDAFSKCNQLVSIDLSTDTVILDCSSGLNNLFNSMINKSNEIDNADDCNNNNHCVKIKEMNLYSARLFELNVVESLSKAIDYKNLNLNYIDLCNNDLGDKEIELISESLKYNFTLETLIVSQNSFGINGIIALSNMIQVNNRLKKLNISNNNFSPEEIDPLFLAVATNKKLEILDISHINSNQMNIITDNFCKMIRDNKSLKSLNIAECYGSLEGLKIMSKSLKENASLNILEMNNIFHKEEDYDQEIFNDKNNSNFLSLIGKFIKENKSLKILEIETIYPIEKEEKNKDQVKLNVKDNKNKLKKVDDPKLLKIINEFIEDIKSNQTLQKMEFTFSGPNYRLFKKRMKDESYTFSFDIERSTEYSSESFFHWRKKFNDEYLI